MTTTQQTGAAEAPNASVPSMLAAFSDELAATVERVGRSVVRVEAGRRTPGSGIVWDDTGLVVTADHVIERDEDIQLGLPDGSTAAATIAGRDEGSDVALLRVSGAPAGSLAPIARGQAPRIGHLTLAVARPGSTLATSVGVVGALSPVTRGWRGGPAESFIWTDAAFYPGFGGGALVDPAGGLIGLATSTSRSGAGIAIPLAALERAVANLQRHGRVKRGFLGIGSQQVELPQGLRQRIGLTQEHGLLIMAVEPNGPADRAGLMIGDVLVALDGEAVADHQALLALLGPDRVGQPAAVRMVRGGEPHEVQVTIGERQAE
jgi:S1-C subfamily serine protease